LHGCELDVMRLFLLSYCMTAIAIQRGRIPIHASGIRVNQDAILFSGASGRGKSTLAANFLKRGYEIITDDVAVLDFNVNGLPLVVPGYPRIKLWEDSLENLGESPEIYQRVRAGVDKYGIPLFKGYASNPLPIMAIFLLDESQSSQIQIDPIHGFERYLALKNNIFGKRILFMMNMHKNEFQQLVSLADRTKVFSLKYTHRIEQIGDLLDKLEQHFVESGRGR
jgi:hypothetical protein